MEVHGENESWAVVSLRLVVRLRRTSGVMEQRKNESASAGYLARRLADSFLRCSTTPAAAAGGRQAQVSMLPMVSMVKPTKAHWRARNATMR